MTDDEEKQVKESVFWRLRKLEVIGTTSTMLMLVRLTRELLAELRPQDLTPRAAVLAQQLRRCCYPVTLPDERITQAIAVIGADYEPDPNWQDKRRANMEHGRLRRAWNKIRGKR